jgi:hypothetical protein
MPPRKACRARNAGRTLLTHRRSFGVGAVHADRASFFASSAVPLLLPVPRRSDAPLFLGHLRESVKRRGARVARFAMRIAARKKFLALAARKTVEALYNRDDESGDAYRSNLTRQ